MQPNEIKSKLKEHIIGQDVALDSVSVSMYLKDKLDNLKDDEKKFNSRPSNMILVGDTGTGKTEIARRIAEITSRPFVSFPVTRLSERGYVGGSVDDIINAITGSAIRFLKNGIIESEDNRQKAIEDILVKALFAKELENINTESIFPIIIRKNVSEINMSPFSGRGAPPLPPFMRQEKYEISISPISFEDAVKSVAYSNNIEGKTDDELSNDVQEVASRSVVFLDEVDKLIEGDGRGMVSRTGVQYELLALVEGSMYETQYGQISTDRMLFISAGAFSDSSPDQLIPELIGRFPVRVFLNKFEDSSVYKKILDTKYSISKQQEWLLDDIKGFKFSSDAKEAIAEYAFRMNKADKNIGARVLDRIIQPIMKHYLLNVGKGPITRKLVDDSIKTEIEKLENSKGEKKVIGF